MDKLTPHQEESKSPIEQQSVLFELKEKVNEYKDLIFSSPTVNWILGDSSIAKLLAQIQDEKIVNAIAYIKEKWEAYKKMQDNAEKMLDVFYEEAGVNRELYRKEQSALIHNISKRFDALETGDEVEKIATPETDKWKAWEKAHPDKAARFDELSEKSLDLMLADEPFDDFVRDFFTKILEYEGQKSLEFKLPT